MHRTFLAVEKVQETFLFEKGEGKIKVLSKIETERVLERESCKFNRNDLVHNFDSPSTKCRIFNDFTMTWPSE